MATTSYGSITIVDITDIGEFSVYPKCNMPTTVIYDPDQTSYTPDWGQNSLTITPSAYYAGTNVTTSASYTWTRQVGIQAASSISSDNGESVSDGVLTVAQNQFNDTVSLLTYIVTASYMEPTSGQTLTAEGQITFSLVRQASTTKTAKITGDNIFKYDAERNVLPTSITLTATVNNASISGWQYKNSSGTWTTIPNSGTSETLTISPDSSCFVNDSMTVKLVTDDDNVYDIFSIVKLYDGTAGDSVVSAVLSNDNQMLPADSDGNVTDYTSATSTITIYEGGEDVTSSWTITKEGASVTLDTTTADNVAKVTDMDGTSGYVTFTCTKTGYSKIVKTFSLIAIEAGADGITPVLYSVETDYRAVNRDILNVYTPSSITFNAYEQTGTAIAEYSGRFIVTETKLVDGSETNEVTYTSTKNESSINYSIKNATATSITCALYEAGGTSNMLDFQSVVVTSDGATGEQGEQGESGVSAINVILGNEAEVIPCTSSNTTQTALTITIPFGAYQGTSRVGATVSVPTLFGSTATTSAATTSGDGSIVYTISSGVSVANAKGSITLTFTVTATDGTTSTIVKTFTWTRSTAATNGENAVVLQVATPNGNILENGAAPIDDIEIVGYLRSGSTDVTDSATWSFKYYEYGTGYTDVSSNSGFSVDSNVLTVLPDAVDGYVSIEINATYDGSTYTAYQSVIDKTDPIQVSVLSTIGNQIVNGNGVGCIYARVTRNGVEIDQVPNDLTSSTTTPSNPSNGDYYVALNSTNKTAKLMMYSGGSWTEVSQTASYAWTYRDADNNVITDASARPATDGKFIYIDGTLVNGRITADVAVTVN